MNNILKFHKLPKLSAYTIECYFDIFERKRILSIRNDLLEQRMLDKKIFSGCHSIDGELSSDVYIILLSFNNYPSISNWIALKDQLIFGRVSALDILISEYPNYSDEMTFIFPTVDEFKNAFYIFTKKTLERNKEYIFNYSNKLKRIEAENPSIINFLKKDKK